MDQVRFKIGSDMVCLNCIIFLKNACHKFFLVHFGILCLIRYLVFDISEDVNPILIPITIVVRVGDEGGVEPATKFSTRVGSLEGSLYLEGVARKEVGDLFQGVVVFYVKNKLKSEIFNVKKSL